MDPGTTTVLGSSSLAPFVALRFLTRSTLLQESVLRLSASSTRSLVTSSSCKSTPSLFASAPLAIARACPRKLSPSVSADGTLPRSLVVFLARGHCIHSGRKSCDTDSWLWCPRGTSCPPARTRPRRLRPRTRHRQRRRPWFRLSFPPSCTSALPHGPPSARPAPRRLSLRVGPVAFFGRRRPCDLGRASAVQRRPRTRLFYSRCRDAQALPRPGRYLDQFGRRRRAQDSQRGGCAACAWVERRGLDGRGRGEAHWRGKGAHDEDEGDQRQEGEAPLGDA